MNCALERLAISRASVVLPVPGGPQRIREWSCPDSMARRSGLPGPRTCCWPTTSSRDRGRIRSASGRDGSGALVSAALTLSSLGGRSDHIRPGRQRESQLRGRHGNIDLDILEHDGDGLAELVFENHPLQCSLGIEAEKRALEIGRGAARLDIDPVEAFARTDDGFREVLAYVDGSRKQHCRRGGECRG